MPVRANAEELALMAQGTGAELVPGWLRKNACQETPDVSARGRNLEQRRLVEWLRHDAT
jgi:hypothetical protein